MHMCRGQCLYLDKCKDLQLHSVRCMPKTDVADVMDLVPGSNSTRAEA